MSTEGYLGNDKLKKVGVEISFTEDEAKEILKCSEDPIYFILKRILGCHSIPRLPIT